jgi:hypothetical protein
MKTKILTILKLGQNTGIPETALRMEIELRFRIRVGEMEFAAALNSLCEGGHIEGTEDDITGDRIWKLAEAKK